MCLDNIALYGVYLDVPKEILRFRLKNRGDNEDEINRRLDADNQMFKNIYKEADDLSINILKYDDMVEIKIPNEEN